MHFVASLPLHFRHECLEFFPFLHQFQDLFLENVPRVGQIHQLADVAPVGHHFFVQGRHFLLLLFYQRLDLGDSLGGVEGHLAALGVQFLVDDGGRFAAAVIAINIAIASRLLKGRHGRVPVARVGVALFQFQGSLVGDGEHVGETHLFAKGLVVGNDNDGSLAVAPVRQYLAQGLDTFHVQVVRDLVQQVQVARLEGEHCQRYPGLFSPRQLPDHPQCLVAPESQPPQHGPGLLVGHVQVPIGSRPGVLRHQIHRPALRIEFLRQVLRKDSQFEVGVLDPVPVQQGEGSPQRVQERRLAGAVRTADEDFHALLDVELDIRDERDGIVSGLVIIAIIVVGVGVSHRRTVAEGQQNPVVPNVVSAVPVIGTPLRWRRRKQTQPRFEALDFRHRIVGGRIQESLGLHLFDLLDPGLRRRRLGGGRPVLVDKGLELGGLFEVFFVFGGGRVGPVTLLLQVLVVRAGLVDLQGSPAGNLGNVLAGVEQFDVVGDQDHRPRVVGFQVVGEPGPGGPVQVVARFVQQRQGRLR
mmetsp:Transcript_15737/g.43545  ORF Transcript_15737/g.43545 Transcript_15737/m.43545 type:complete len:527 (-) Transcript_15737:604-2184(-)